MHTQTCDLLAPAKRILEADCVCSLRGTQVLYALLGVIYDLKLMYKVTICSDF